MDGQLNQKIRNLCKWEHQLDNHDGAVRVDEQRQATPGAATPRKTSMADSYRNRSIILMHQFAIRL